MVKFEANFYLYAENVDRATDFYRENFNFRKLGNIEEEIPDKWAALKLENTIIWLGKNGSSTGLILLINKNIETFILELTKKGVNFIIPKEMKNSKKLLNNIIETNWGKHSWFLDSEKNVVMLFEPAEG